MKFTLAFSSKVPETFNTSHTLVANGIKLWTKSDYYHVELIIDGYWMSSRVSSNGVKLIPLRKPLSDSYEYYNIDIDDLTSKRLKQVIKFIIEQEETGYDWLAIFLTQFFKLGISSRKEWFCSEIVTKVLQLLFVEELLDVEPARVSPGKLYELLERRLTKVEG